MKRIASNVATRLRALALLAALVSGVGHAIVYDLDWHVVGAGDGDTFVKAGRFSLGSTIGQPAAATVSLTPHALSSGFWQQAILTAPNSIDIDGNAVYDPLTDGLMINRYLAGVRGAALIQGAVATGGIRWTAPAIEAYLGGIAPLLDVDGSGGAGDRATDGLLIVRYLFGLRGSALISGAVGAAATRSSAPAIETYIQGLRP